MGRQEMLILTFGLAKEKPQSCDIGILKRDLLYCFNFVSKVSTLECEKYNALIITIIIIQSPQCKKYSLHFIFHSLLALQPLLNILHQILCLS